MNSTLINVPTDRTYNVTVYGADSHRILEVQGIDNLHSFCLGLQVLSDHPRYRLDFYGTRDLLLSGHYGVTWDEVEREAMREAMEDWPEGQGVSSSDRNHITIGAMYGRKVI